MNNIKNLRKNSGLTQIELSNLMNTDQSTISKWELEKCLPDIQMLIKLADYFHVSIDFVLGRSECDRQQIRNENNSFSEKQENLIPLIQMLNDRQCELTQDYLENILDIVTEQQQNWGV